MTLREQLHALTIATQAARAAGKLMRQNLARPKHVNESSQHDIKLELDVRCQKLIERTLRRAFPTVAILGEEGILGDPASAARWVVDPIDGTVNFTYGIPHACVSIALQVRDDQSPHAGCPLRGYTTLVGVVYDPFLDELWSAVRGQKAKLNGKPIAVSSRARLDETIIAMGFAKYTKTLALMLPVFNRLVHRVRKIRLLGAAALSMTWTANGRLDAYLENGVRLWDVAAGGLIVECAGGEFWWQPVEGDYAVEICVSNGKLRKKLRAE
jgi:myo-inositol-1(or 4)-monophosphatase